MASRKTDRKFMGMAVEEMQLSRSEHADKSDPLVGAVLVSSRAKLLDKAHRGKLRSGEHAEFTLIERQQGSRDLEGSTLYVTLEPCVVRQPPKVSCAKRIISARIQRVVIGIPDPNPRITGKGIKFLQDSRIDVDFFDLDLVQEIKEANVDFIREQEEADVSQEDLREFAGPSEEETRAVEGATVDDFSPDALGKYLQARGKDPDMPFAELRVFLHKNGFLTRAGDTGEYTPTVAGVLLFGADPASSLPHSRVAFESHLGPKEVLTDVEGPIVLLTERIEDLFLQYVKSFTEIRAFERVTTPEYPLEAFREAVVNAIAHRDYRPGARVMVQMQSDRIVVRSPGVPVAPLSLQRIRNYDAPPFSRNPRIAQTLNYLDKMEEKATGLQRMRKYLEASGLRGPRFDIDTGYFVVTFFGSAYPPGLVRIAPDVEATLDKQQRSLVNFVIRAGRVTATECAEEFGIHRKTASQRLKGLEDLGLIEKRGRGRSTHYVLVGS